jgi:hypothetical protein
MIDRVDKRLVFKPLNNRPYLHGETERRTGQSTPGRAARRWRLELRSMALLVAETSPQPALFVPYHHLCARRTPRIRAGRAQIGGRH